MVFGGNILWICLLQLLPKLRELLIVEFSEAWNSAFDLDYLNSFGGMMEMTLQTKRPVIS
jgi:hypothetical protein